MADNHRAKAEALMARTGYGGKMGAAPKAAADMGKFARGGATKKHGGTKVNVIVAPQGGGARPVPVPVPAGGGAPPMAGPPPGAGAMPPRPMMPPQGAMPPAGGPMKKGGAVGRRSPISATDAGAGSGEGRMEKVKAYGGRDR